MFQSKEFWNGYRAAEARQPYCDNENIPFDWQEGYHYAIKHPGLKEPTSPYEGDALYEDFITEFFDWM